jgi:hypothetical protein
MPWTEHPTCPVCVAMCTAAPLVAFLRRTRPWLRWRCRCAGRPHPLLLLHPHTVEGCAGFAGLPGPPPALMGVSHGLD